MSLTHRHILAVGFFVTSFGLTGTADAQFLGNIGGVAIDAKGMLHDVRTLSDDQRLELLKNEAVAEPDDEAFQTAAQLRRISLRNLEGEVHNYHRKGQELPDEVKYLGGLTQVQFLVFDVQLRDVYLLGSAEPWKQLPTGEVVGQKSNRPVLHLDDLIVVLRYAFSRQPSAPFLGCSIDPTAEGMARYATYLNRLGRMDRSRVKQIFAGMEQAMGPQEVRLFGMEPTSRFALVVLAADYRLKRIALGHDPSPVKEVTNYLDLTAKKFRNGPQKQHQWWFQAGYDAIHETPDHLAFELIGQGVKVSTASTTAGDPTASQEATEFSESFTKHFPEIAEQNPVFGELQNLIALATAAELIAEKLRSGNNARFWSPKHFLETKACPIREYHVPKTVPSLANYRLIRNRHWLISISGGVRIPPEELTRPQIRSVAPHRNLTRVQKANTRLDSNGTWWQNGSE